MTLLASRRRAVDRLQATPARRSTRTRDSLQAFNKLTTVVGGQHRIASDPPLIVPLEELFTGT
jgi:hypothetical protein